MKFFILFCFKIGSNFFLNLNFKLGRTNLYKVLVMNASCAMQKCTQATNFKWILP